MLDQIITDYKENHRDNHITHCCNQEGLSNAISIAAKSIDQQGKIHSHQRRIGRKNLEIFAEKLMCKELEISRANTFDEILEIVESVKLTGIGKLVYYDTAERIGYYKNCFPEKIYLHAGTRTGIRNFLGDKKIRGKKFIHLSELPNELQSLNLNASEWENIFCIYKKSFEVNKFIARRNSYKSGSSC
jgi:hypothetical protein